MKETDNNLHNASGISNNRLGVKGAPRLGEVFLSKGKITQEQLNKALKLQKERNIRIGESLVECGFTTELEIVEALSEKLGVPAVPLVQPIYTKELKLKMQAILNEAFCRKNSVLPLSKEVNQLVIAMDDPSDIIVLQNIRILAGCEVSPRIATSSEILTGIEELFADKSVMDDLSEDERSRGPGMPSDIDSGKGQEIPEFKESQVLKITEYIMTRALDDGASDIHIEMHDDGPKIRMRIDGELHDVETPPRTLYLPVVSRFKVLAALNISEKRLPQDGGFTMNYKGSKIDLRVSTIPTMFGEKMVLRILNYQGTQLNFHSLGLEGENEDNMKKTIQFPHGLVLVTGPTGSGKSTTLYAILQSIQGVSRKNILTIEDPVEYKLAGINQVQVKSAIGMTFASALRAFLRQDPDVIMVGEVRDGETAEICVRSALTGHLVISTLHTNDALGAITRLIDLGIEPFLLSSTLVLTASQRLVRKLCPHCRTVYKPEPQTLKRFSLLNDKLQNITTFYKAVGCAKCHNRGFAGRVGIFEVFPINEQLKEAIASRMPESEIRQQLRKQGTKFMVDDGLDKIKSGITTLDEVISATLIT